jgi:predicted nucleic acid-binding protein
VAPSDFPASGLIDTTFVIHLVNPKAEYHAHALRYFQALQVNQTKLFLPTLVMAEYAVKGGRDGVSAVLATLGAQVCGFDLVAALRYGELAQQHPTIFRVPTPEKERSIVDLMLVAIADTLNIESIVTTDKHICGPLRAGTPVQALDIKVPIEQLSPLWRESL